MLGLKLGLCLGHRRPGGGGPPVITANTEPQLAAADDTDTPADVFTTGTYSSSAGTIDSVVTTYLVNGSAEASTFDLQAGDALQVTQLVTDSATNSRTFSTGIVTVTQLAAPVTRASLTQEIIDAHETNADTNFQGWSDEAGFTVFTETTPDAMRARIETWKSNPDDLIKIVCDWDGILDMTSSTLRGPSGSDLTSDAGEFGGYQRPTGGVWIQAASGKSPVFGNQSIFVYGMPRIFFEGIGFAGQALGASGDGIRNIQFQGTGTFPLYPCAAFKDCVFGLTVHRPSEPATEYVKAIGCSGAYSLHVENVEFAGTRDQIQGVAKYLRVWNCQSRKVLSDFVTQFGFSSTNWIGERVYAWIEGNVVRDLVDQSGFNGLHTDFYQMGTSADVHAGNSALVRWNVAHMKTSISTDSGSQFVYMDDHTTAENSAAIYENIGAISAYNGAQLYDPSGVGHFFVEDNLFMRAGNYLQSGPSVYPRVRVSATVGNNGGTANVARNYLTLVSDDENEATTSGNYFIDPRAGVVSGDASSIGEAKRPEDVFDATFSRDGSDVLTYSITDEDTADYATAFYAVADFFTPTAGWGVDAGPVDPETWAAAPARPTPPVASNFVTNGAYWIDPSNLPGDTTVVEYEVKMKFPTESVAFTTAFAQISATRVEVSTANSPRLLVEDGAGSTANGLSTTSFLEILPLTTGQMSTLNVLIDYEAAEVTVTLDGDSQTIPFNGTQTTTFAQSGRQVVIGGNGAGLSLLPSDAEVEHFKIWRTTSGARTLHKEISIAAQGSISGINADPWHGGGSVTSA